MKKHRQKKNRNNIFDLKGRQKRFKRRKNKQEKDRNYSNVILRMIETYELEDEDWMGFKLKPNNPYTFHHIKEKHNGGHKTFENGAPLTERGHQFLNYLDAHNKRAYNDYQQLFRRINASRKPIDDDFREDIYGMLLDTFYYNIYNLPQSILNKYEPYLRRTLVRK